MTADCLSDHIAGCSPLFLPGGPGRPGEAGIKMVDVRILSLVICSGMSALLDSMAIWNNVGNND